MKIKEIRCTDDLFFTGDLHLCHSGVIQFANRPVKDVDEMHELIIKNWNNKISRNSTTYILGDVSWKRLEHCEHILDQLNGKKILISGNHDDRSIEKYFEEYYDMLYLKIRDEINYYAHLCHYPLFEWWKQQAGGIMLHAHTHGKINCMDFCNPQRLDVGLDCHNMFPLSWEEIKQILKERKLKYVNS
jgi:calcineurin-like phosphoesterase family protein